MFTTVLVANRGEIAVRVMRTLRDMGIRTVAVYSDADAGARHVREADIAVRLGPAPARESYLNIERVVQAAIDTGAEAVHPGYGFLAENADFAQALADKGIAFIGPSVSAVEVMGDKIRAKTAVAKAGVPVVPGRTEPGMTDADLVAAAEEVGFPVLVKPSAGGGGKGMFLVESAEDLPEALKSARRTAASSFGDDTLFLERFVTRPRHIEVQVLADSQGTTVHLGERECSLQRRHQKVVEEAPSALLDEATRARIGASAVDTAKAVGYVGAGTVEFIVSADRPDEFFFMEMNTRLQVEHPVTELVTGIDLVEQQVRVASGLPLPFSQDEIRLDGHAVEVRTYAEDPARGFLPTGGTVLRLDEPTGDDVRVDSSLLEGTVVGSTYDPMLNKVIAWGPDRSTALAKLDRALADQVVLGVTTNTAFLRALIQHPEVVAGNLDTGFIERHLDELTVDEVPVEALAVYALQESLRRDGTDPWSTGWRPGAPAAQRWLLALPGGRTANVSLTHPARSGARFLPQLASPLAGGAVTVDDLTFEATDALEGDDVLLTTGGRTTRWVTAVDGTHVWVGHEGASWVLHEAVRHLRTDEHGHDGDVTSPMPGSVIAVRASQGETVSKGHPLVVVEAMKMEHTLTAPLDGTIGEVLVRVGQQVAVDELLVTVTAPRQAES
ncbi:MAG: acetyl/propionyl/methylcrotonyl-CoA carboxylase subunit alpha [Actinomycetota bacterium]|nr:acetyl/propionyl/methylcrotonyl-CoA carboxylase subunit alpha [Actinomycetota bacterium]